MRIKFITLGCKVNINETEKMIEQAKGYGFKVVYGSEEADIIVLNSCTVTNSSDKKTLSLLKKSNKTDAFTVLIGCFVSNHGKEYDADLVLTNEEKKDTIEILAKRFEMHRKPVELELDNKTRAFVKIQDGCNRFCSFCIIPYARGRSKSIDLNEIIEDIKDRVKKGYKEFVLTGIHISSYGLDNGSSLIEVVETVSKIEGVKRIRLGSLEPTIIDEEFTSRLSKVDQICPHFHLSLQSGSDRVLKDMNRRYTSNEYYSSVSILRKYFDKPAITTDIIVGYPTETEETFMETLAFVNRVKFANAHIFTYSHRTGTKASRLMDLSNKTKKERYHILREACDKHFGEYLDSFVGEEVEVLFEKNKGLTRRYLPVEKTDLDHRNDIINCVIKSRKGGILIV